MWALFYRLWILFITSYNTFCGCTIYVINHQVIIPSCPTALAKTCVWRLHNSAWLIWQWGRLSCNGVVSEYSQYTLQYIELVEKVVPDGWVLPHSHCHMFAWERFCITRTNQALHTQYQYPHMPRYRLVAIIVRPCGGVLSSMHSLVQCTNYHISVDLRCTTCLGIITSATLFQIAHYCPHLSGSSSIPFLNFFL